VGKTPGNLDDQYGYRAKTARVYNGPEYNGEKGNEQTRKRRKKYNIATPLYVLPIVPELRAHAALTARHMQKITEIIFL